jgi:hypothetical protein
VLVPAAGVLELVGHLVQTHSVVSERDWMQARDIVASLATPEDLVAFAPRWTDPLGRHYFGDRIATLEREGRPDETRFVRAIEVSIRSKHLPAFEGLVGGTAGGADLGLNRQFWGYTTENANAEWMEKNTPRGASVFIHDTAWDSWAKMQEEKRVRPDLRGVGSPAEAQIALVQHELHMNEVDYSIWVALGTDAPVYVITHDGVPIVSIYQRR